MGIYNWIMRKYGPEIKGCNLIEEEIIIESAKNFIVQKTVEENKNLDWDQVEDFINRGVSLWNHVVSAAFSKYHHKEGIIIETTTTNNDTQWNLFDSVNDRYEFKRLKNEKSYIYKIILANYYGFFVKEHNEFNKNNPIIMAVNSGKNMIQSGVLDHMLNYYPGFIENESEISLIEGPFIVGTNDFIKSLDILLNINSNSFFYYNHILNANELYAGFFPSFVIGNNIYAETPHKFENQDFKISTHFIFNDELLANELRAFYNDYKKIFTTKISNVNDLESYLVDSYEKDINKMSLVLKDKKK